MSTINNNFRVPGRDDDATPVDNKPRAFIKPKKDFRKVMDDDKGSKDDQEADAVGAGENQPKDMAGVKDVKKRPSLLSLAGQSANDATDELATKKNAGLFSGVLTRKDRFQGSKNPVFDQGVDFEDQVADVPPKLGAPKVDAPKFKPRPVVESNYDMPVVDEDDSYDADEAALAAALLAFAKDVASSAKVLPEPEAPAPEVAPNLKQAVGQNVKQTDKTNLSENDVRFLQSAIDQQLPASVDNPKEKDSPFAVYKNLRKNANQLADAVDSDMKPVLTRKDSAKSSNAPSDFSMVNQPPVQINAAPVAEAKPVTRSPHIQEIISQMVDKLTVMQSMGTSETTVVIKNNPLFEGAKVTLTGFDSATREFNVAFENLSAAAKRLLDISTNQHDLKMAMAEKGFTVHIIVTNTETENHASGERGSREDDRPGSNRQNQHDQDEESQA